jgi:hypothetical protein
MKNDPSNLQVKIKRRINGPVANGGLRLALTSQAQRYFHIKNNKSVNEKKGRGHGCQVVLWIRIL